MPKKFSLDARGLFCPEPIMMLHQQFRQMQLGDECEVLATDPATERDIPKFCNFLEHELVSQSLEDGNYCYLLRKMSE